MQRYKLTEHHKIPRNGVDISGTNDIRNKVLLPENQHINRHRIFGNMEFHYQILRILEWNSSVIQRKTARDIAWIVQQDPKYIYVD